MSLFSQDGKAFLWSNLVGEERRTQRKPAIQTQYPQSMSHQVSNLGCFGERPVPIFNIDLRGIVILNGKFKFHIVAHYIYRLSYKFKKYINER